MSSPSHQLFLQAMMGKGAVDSTEAKDMYKRSCQAFGEHYDATNFSSFISALNKHLKPLDMELSHVHLEDAPKQWYGLVNRTQDAAARAASNYSPAELEFFNHVMEQLVLSEDGLAPSTVLLNSVSTLQRKLTYKDAQSFLKTLVTDKWLTEVTQGVYGPGPRFILELRPFLKDLFGEEVIDCHICKDPVVRGQYCLTEQCNVKLHLYCVAKLANGRETCRCPGCHSNWSHDIPSIALEEDHAPSMDMGAGSSRHGSRPQGAQGSSQRKKTGRSK